MNDLDKFDKHIVHLLRRQGRISNQDLAQTVGLSSAACLRRVRQLEQSGVIRGYHADIAPQVLGFDMTVLVEIALSSESADALTAFERAVAAEEGILECHLMSGESDYWLKIGVRDLTDYERMHRQVLANLPFVARIKSSFSIRQVAPHAGR